MQGKVLLGSPAGFRGLGARGAAYLPTTARSAIVFSVCLILLWTLRIWRASPGLGCLEVGSRPEVNLCEAKSCFVADHQSSANATSAFRLPHIAPNIFQVFLSDESECGGIGDMTLSWIARSPSYTYTMLRSAVAQEAVARLAASEARYHNALGVYNSMTRLVMRADFVRYLFLALEGGFYGDTDTELIQPPHMWATNQTHKAAAKLIVGIEGDASPPERGMKYEVQFSQWAMAGAKDHPVLWAMVDRILQQVPGKTEFTDADVLDVSGPRGWTEIIFAHLSRQAGSEIGWRDLHGLREPQLIGDTLVLPIDGFGTGLHHSRASREINRNTMVIHHFQGSWRQG